MAEDNTPKRGRGRPRKPAKPFLKSEYTPLRGGGYNTDPEIKRAEWKGIRNTTNQKVKFWLKHSSEYVPNKKAKNRVLSHARNQYKTAAARETFGAKQSDSIKPKQVTARKARRAGIAKKQTKDLYSGFRVQLTSESRGHLLMAGISSYTGNQVTTTKSKIIMAFNGAIDTYISTHLDKPLLQYMKARQLESVGYGKIHKSFKKKSTGEVFENHRSSKVGEPAANMSGELANSYKNSFVRGSKRISFFNTAPYAEFLHKRGSLSFYLESRRYSSSFTKKPPQLTVPNVKNGIRGLAEASLRAKYQYI